MAEEVVIDSIRNADASTSISLMQRVNEAPVMAAEPTFKTFASAMVTFQKGKPVSELMIRGKSVFTLKGDDGTVMVEFAKRLNSLYKEGKLRSDRIRPARDRDGKDAIFVGFEPVLFVTPKLAKPEGVGTGTLTIKLVNSLVASLGGTPNHAPSGTVTPQLASRGVFRGLASWYGGFFHGRRAANGERFDQWGLTAAHKTLPFGTMLMVTNMKTNRSVMVRVTDRGPYIPGRSLDLSKGAADAIGMLGSGVAHVRVTILSLDRKFRGWK